jgi:hypothetical protein
MVSSIGQREQSTILLASMKGLSMKHVKTLYAAAVLALASIGTAAAQTTVLNEGFENVAGLSGWTQVNNSAPPGTSWFQGVPDIFPAYSGPADSYAAASYLSAANGTGTIDNWLITPTLNLSGLTDISFYTRHDPQPGYSDLLEVRFAYGNTSNPDDFDTVISIVGNLGGYPTEWSLFDTNYALEGPGRFAFRYVGPADLANYIGIDSVTVVTAVPEPSAWMMLAMGLGGFGLLRRKQKS